LERDDTAVNQQGSKKRDQFTIVRYQGNKREIRILLVIKGSKRIDFMFEEEIVCCRYSKKEIFV